MILIKKVIHARKFDKDFKRMENRGVKVDRFFDVIEKLTTGKPLEQKNEDHPLHGKLVGKRDCHIEPD